MEKLPDEILQQVFALVPLVDVLQNLCLVCQRWKRIIADVKFIPWKKVYYQYLKGVDHASLTLQVVLQRYGLTKENPRCMLGFIRCVAAVRTCHCEDPSTALTYLQCHSLYRKAEVCIARKLPDLDGHKERPAYIRAVMAAIVLLAGDFRDIQKLVDYLQSPSSSMLLRDTLEILYSTATLLYAMRENEVKISNRFHYSVSYCLHHLENPLCSTPSINDPELPSSETGPRPTSEQQLILNHKLNPGDRVKIVGSAGTGKTFTLVQYTKKWSKLRFLYLAFNKTVIEQVPKVFPKYVTGKTFHSLARKAVGKSYGNKFIRDIQIDKIRLFLENSGYPLDHAKGIVQTLKAFFASADEFITVEHTGSGEDVEECKKQIIVEKAEQIWTKMKALGSTKEKAFHMPFDGYLKLWQLQKPSLSTDKKRYDVIMVDQAQDCTPVMMNTVLSQKCAVIVVGDPHQQIYTFRGADNRVLDVPNSRIFYLTQSFRFGYEIAYVGATLLDVSRKIRKTVVGNNRDSVVSMQGKEAWLSRTNRNVFDNAVKVIDEHPSAKIHFLGGIKVVRLAIIEDLWRVKHPEPNYKFKSKIKKHVEKGFKGIKDYAATEDKQLLIQIRIVENHGERVPELVKRIRQCHVLDPESAGYILGTVHKAKGLEFDTVQIYNDFRYKSTLDKLSQNQIALPEMIPVNFSNLLYVAVTRAKKRLILPKFFAHILKFAKEYCVRFELSTALRNTTPPVCVQCHHQVPIPADPVLIPKRINHPYIVDDTKTRKGFLCPSCATRELGPIAELAGYSRMEQGAENIVVPFEARSYLEDF